VPSAFSTTTKNPEPIPTKFPTGQTTLYHQLKAKPESLHRIKK